MRRQGHLDHWTQDLLTATAFLTRLPLPGTVHAGSDLARSLRAYPLVGALVGGLAALGYWLASTLGLPPWCSAALAVGAAVLLTGALHEDGLADVADGFGGGSDRARKLAIMRDSRIGSYGVIALVLFLSLRGGALAALATPAAAAVALIAAHSLSRGLLPLAMRLLPPARSDGLAAAHGRPGTADTRTALLLAVLLCLLLLDLGAAALVLVTALSVVALVGWLARRQIGGYTGDVLGAMQQTAETIILLTLVSQA